MASMMNVRGYERAARMLLVFGIFGAAATGALGATPPPAVDTTGGGGHGQRYLEIATPNSAGPEVIRVKPLTTPGLTGGADVLYVANPFEAYDSNSAEPSRMFTAAILVCNPVPVDFGAFTSIAVYGAEVVPSERTEVAQYSIQRADAACPNLTTDESCWSAPLFVSQGVFADVVAPFFSAENSVQPDLADINAYVAKFLGNPTAPSKPAMQLVKNIPAPAYEVAYLDINDVVASFLGTRTYATTQGTGLCTCPSIVTCGVTACYNEIVCNKGVSCVLGTCSNNGTSCETVYDCRSQCIDGFCTDRCGRCSP